MNLFTSNGDNSYGNGVSLYGRGGKRGGYGGGRAVRGYGSSGAYNKGIPLSRHTYVQRPKSYSAQRARPYRPRYRPSNRGYGSSSLGYGASNGGYGSSGLGYSAQSGYKSPLPSPNQLFGSYSRSYNNKPSYNRPSYDRVSAPDSYESLYDGYDSSDGDQPYEEYADGEVISTQVYDGYEIVREPVNSYNGNYNSNYNY
ncbi:unnamed protein product [Oppiella nova]|uniref:Uncharacterized protein n=1 Tax=Oppiella nova TaxID=334625 RepID=A0A7R9QQT7_9ACAR|nr:unnamed protein product [Oppiella nova]CAG2171681.1 unnamed protein product [Oppiella nova]